jgi:hypothetical protein
VNAVSFLVSAALIAGIRHGQERDPHATAPSIRPGSTRCDRGRRSPPRYSHSALP